MENINNSRNTLTVKNKNIKYDDYNKIEWINYFNDELIVESINNQINNSINQNRNISNYNRGNKNKNINNINNINININIFKNNKNSHYNKNKEIKEIINNKELYENKNYYFSEIKELYGPKKILSFEYQEAITIDNFSDKLNVFNQKEKEKNGNINAGGSDDFGNKKFNNIIVIDNGNENGNGKDNLKNKNNNNDKTILRNKKNKSKSVDLDDNSNKTGIKNRNNKKNKINLSEDDNNDKNNKNKFHFKRYEPQNSYSLRHKMKKDYKIDGHFHPNEEKPEFIDNKIFLGRTLPEMIVLNRYGLVTDEDFEIYKKYHEYNKLNNKRNKKTGFY